MADQDGYVVGESVFAKMGVYRYWPGEVRGKVEGPDEGYWIHFFGTHDMSVVSGNKIKKYNKLSKEKYGVVKKGAKLEAVFRKALEEIGSKVQESKAKIGKIILDKGYRYIPPISALALLSNRRQRQVAASEVTAHEVIKIKSSLSYLKQPEFEQVEEALPSVKQVEEALTSVEHIEQALTSVEQVEEALTSVEQVEEALPSVKQVEEALTSVKKVEEALTAVEHIEQALTSVEQVEEDLTSMEQVEEDLTSMEQVEEDLTSMVQVEEALTSMEQVEEDLTSVEHIEQALTSVEQVEEDLTSSMEQVEEDLTSMEQVKDDLTSMVQVEEALTSMEQVEEDLTSMEQVEEALTSAEQVDESSTSLELFDAFSTFVEVENVEGVSSFIEPVQDEDSSMIEELDEVLTSGSQHSDLNSGTIFLGNMDIDNEQEKRNQRAAQLKILHAERAIIDILNGIVKSLRVEFADLDKAIELVERLESVEVHQATQMMLKKHPKIVSVIFRLRYYIGNEEVWKFSDDEKIEFAKKRTIITELANVVFKHFLTLFGTTCEEDFLVVYQKKLSEFTKLVDGVPFNRVLGLTEITESGEWQVYDFDEK